MEVVLVVEDNRKVEHPVALEVVDVAAAVASKPKLSQVKIITAVHRRPVVQAVVVEAVQADLAT